MYLPGVNKLTLSAAALAAMVEDQINKDARGLGQQVHVDPNQVHIWQSPDGTRGVEFTVSTDEVKSGDAVERPIGMKVQHGVPYRGSDSIFDYDPLDEMHGRAPTPSHAWPNVVKGPTL